MIKIDKSIVAYSVVTDKTTERSTQLHEAVSRPETLPGTTYKLKTPLSDHALYVTINDIILNQGTPEECRYPFEVFVNSKEMSHYQWVLALTRVISAVFRKGGECAFLVEELKSVFDPKGGYFKKGGKFMPSLVAEIGEVLERHLVGLGLYQKDESLAEAAKAMVAEKMTDELKAQLCPKCGEAALVSMGGCLTCTSCGDSRCT